jgi:hypothetical protein
LLVALIPQQRGDYELDESHGVGFYRSGGGNADAKLAPIATVGRLVVDVVTETTVTGSLYAVIDDANEVNGRFELTVCPKQ